MAEIDIDVRDHRPIYRKLSKRLHLIEMIATTFKYIRAHTEKTEVSEESERTKRKL